VTDYAEIMWLVRLNTERFHPIYLFNIITNNIVLIIPTNDIGMYLVWYIFFFIVIPIYLFSYYFRKYFLKHLYLCIMK
jgi:hypothetical protein